MEKAITSEQLAVFRKFATELAPTPEEDLLLLENTFQFKKYRKGEILLKAGEVCRHFWFILKGSMRTYSIEEDREINLSFFFENSIGTDFISLRFETASLLTIQAMEATETLVAYKPDYYPVLNSRKSLVELTLRFYQVIYFDEVEHSNSFKLLSPEDRYKYLLKNNPKYLQRVSLTQLASYLGISRKTLTRIRSNIAG